MARVLVIEDDADLSEVLRYNLAQAGHDPLLAATGEAGLKVARVENPDIVLLDLMLPDMAGTVVVRSLRGDPLTQGIRIVVVTAKAEEVDRVLGFEIGADDYVVKPYSVRELLLRIAAVLRRGKAPSSDLIEVGELRIDRAAHRVVVGTDEVPLTALEFKLLVTLIERRDLVQARTKLLSDVWGLQGELTTRTVDTHVKRLRDKLGTGGRFIKTVRGVGYRFTEVGVSNRNDAPGGRRRRR